MELTENEPISITDRPRIELEEVRKVGEERTNGKQYVEIPSVFRITQS